MQYQECKLSQISKKINKISSFISQSTHCRRHCSQWETRVHKSATQPKTA